jgi:hypothetical protein
MYERLNLEQSQEKYISDSKQLGMVLDGFYKLWMNREWTRDKTLQKKYPELLQEIPVILGLWQSVKYLKKKLAGCEYTGKQYFEVEVFDKHREPQWVRINASQVTYTDERVIFSIPDPWVKGGVAFIHSVPNHRCGQVKAMFEEELSVQEPESEDPPPYMSREVDDD